MNIGQLFEQFVGANTGSRNAPAARGREAPRSGGVADMLGQFTQGRGGGFAGGLATGGLLGALMGNKKMRKKVGKLGGGAVGYGGSAALGALALKAYQSWQAGQAGQAGHAGPAGGDHAGYGQSARVASTPQLALPSPEAFDPALTQDAAGQPMQLTLVKAMIAAANADGHIDGDEKKAVFEAVDAAALDAEAKAVVLDVLRHPPSVREIAGYAKGPEQATEIYLASRLAIDPDDPSERRYLVELARRMTLPDGLVQEIEAQVDPSPSHAAIGQPT